jgi:hypothetical protein
MSAEEFSRHKSSLASNKLQSDTSLGQEGDRAWEQVRGGGVFRVVVGWGGGGGGGGT